MHISAISTSNLNKQKILNPTFKKSVSTENIISHNMFEVSAKRDAAIIDYLEAAQKRDKQNQKLSLIISGLSLSMIPFALFYFHKHMSPHKKSLNELTDGFKSLKEKTNIPTLETCKSINKKMREYLQAEVNYSKASEEDLKRAGLPKRTNKLLLYGPPGTGKTYFAKIFAKTLDADYLEIKYSDLNHRYIGHHIDNIKAAFENIIEIASKNKDKKYVVTFNEIDAIMVPQQGLVEHGGGHSTFKLEERNVFLNYIDQIEEKAPNVTLIGTTNRLAKVDNLDAAAMSRFSRKMRVDYPDKECLKEALMSHLKELGEGKTFVETNNDKWDAYTESLVNRKFSFRDLDYIIDSSKRYYLTDCIEDKSSKFKFEYLERARDLREITDGEAAYV